MSTANSFLVNPGWGVILRDLGFHPGVVLRRAGLPEDLFSRPKETIRADQYSRLWWALQDEADEPTLPIRIGKTISFETFDPPIFAAMCSETLNAALGRISRFKRLFAPIAIDLDVRKDATVVTVEWLEKTIEPPLLMITTDLVFIVQLARMATRTPIRPLAVTAPLPPGPADAFAAFFGVTIERGPAHTITFAAVDAGMRLLTARAEMWTFFEPELRKRLAELEANAPAAERVRAALLELLPSGLASVGAVSAKLGVSPRTLQRRLQAEAISFQRLLNDTREELARHYLRTTDMAGAEISYLIGFEDPNSFVRAFHEWTGATPEQLRAELRADRAPGVIRKRTVASR